MPYIPLTDEDVKRLHAYDDFSVEVGGDRYLRVKDDGNCIFRNDGCSVHDVKPESCLIFGRENPCFFFPEKSKEAV